MQIGPTISRFSEEQTTLLRYESLEPPTAPTIALPHVRFHLESDRMAQKRTFCVATRPVVEPP
jgi:hypothetical protein